MKYLQILIGALLLTACGGNVEDKPEDQSDKVDSVAVQVDSVAFFKEQITLHPNSTDWLYKKAVFELGQGNLGQSKADLEKAMSIDSSDINVRLLYGNVQLSLTHIDTGKFHYEYVLERDSTNTGALLGMSRLHALLNNSATADAYISRALQSDPYLAEAYFLRGIIYRSDYYQTARQESWDIAVSSFQTAVEQDPDFYSAYVEMGVMYDEIGSELALEYYNSALEIYPYSEEAWYNVGMYHQNRGEMDDALNAYRTLNDIDSTWADPYYNQGYIHLIVQQGDLDSSVYFFSKAIECDPNYYQAYNNLGLAYETKGDLENAKKYYQKAIEVNPDFQLAKDNLNSLQ